MNHLNKLFYSAPTEWFLIVFLVISFWVKFFNNLLKRFFTFFISSHKANLSIARSCFSLKTDFRRSISNKYNNEPTILIFHFNFFLVIVHCPKKYFLKSLFRASTQYLLLGVCKTRNRMKWNGME